MPVLKKQPIKSNGSHRPHSRLNPASRRSNAAIDLSLDEMIDVINLVDYGLKGEQIPVTYNTKVKTFASNIIKMKNMPQTKGNADKIINQLSRKVISENKKEFYSNDSKRLYKSFMQRD